MTPGNTAAKSRIQDLAALNGTPMFARPLHVGRPNVLDAAALYASIRGAIDRLWLTNDGPLLLKLEEEFANFVQAKHCIAVANATIGLQLVLHGLRIDGPILMPAFTFIGTAHAARWLGNEPVFCDVLGEHHTLDPRAVEARMNREISAILAVHLWGRACNIEALQNIADVWGVPLIFDAAHAIGSTYRGRRIGGFGAAEVFSLHATKAINGLEGGLITTNDDSLAEYLRHTRNYGFTGESDVVADLGINAKMNEFSAAMALSNLPHYGRLAAHNRSLLAAYSTALGSCAQARLSPVGDDPEYSHHYALLQLDESCSLSRDALQAILRAENIMARRYFWPGCHRSPPYLGRDKDVDLPITDHLAKTLMQLPTGIQMNESEAFSIGSLVAFCLRNADELSAALAPK